MKGSVYQLKGVSYTYEGSGAPALDMGELSIRGGEVTVFTGPNGSGKSTLLALLSLDITPTKGELLLFGERPVPSRHRRRIGILDQHPYLFDTTVRANVEWGLRARKMVDGMDGQVGEVLDALGLSSYAERRARKLSGGEMQRVALARTLVLNPDILLLDEPTAHVDASSRERIESIVMEWVSREGGTAIVTTHDLALAHRLGGSAYRLQDGRASQTGVDNVFMGHFVGGVGGLFDTGHIKINVAGKRLGEAVTLRAEEVILSTHHLESSVRNNLYGVITDVSLGDGGLLMVTVDCGERIVASITPSGWADLGVSVGERVYVSFKASALRVIE
ncbi:MAG: hypothetical protein C0608_10200 [Deltaproteobacteria bacterium]|nr:MAG: hypothetical protein C0608_10200 [Deltaproteobacteria bacterium]